MKAGEEYQVIGVRFAKSKDGSDSAVVYYATPFEEWEVSGSESVIGHKTGSEYTRDAELVKKIHNLKLNDVVTFQYRKGFQGSAVVCGITVVKAAAK